MNELIDNPLNLAKLSREELDEVILNNKYNKALLRELVRRSMSIIRTQTKTLKWHMEKAESLEKKIMKIEKLLREG